MSSSLQTEKTKHDAKSLANDVANHAENAADRASYKAERAATKVSDSAHKAGVAMGISQPTTGEKIGNTLSKGIDKITGER